MVLVGHLSFEKTRDGSYAVEGIMAQMLVSRGVPRYHVKRNFNPKLSTWEVAEQQQDEDSATILAEFKAMQQHHAKVCVAYRNLL